MRGNRCSKNLAVVVLGLCVAAGCNVDIGPPMSMSDARADAMAMQSDADLAVPRVDAAVPDARPQEPVLGEPAALAGITGAHNQVRSAHGVVDIIWDDQLAAVAQSWADGCQWGHNPDRSTSYPGYVGENLYGSGGVPTGQAVTDLWAAEESSYDYDTNTCTGVCGHYTQIVWANSTKLGCGIATCSGGQVVNFVVCNYAPGGNFGGARPY